MMPRSAEALPSVGAWRRLRSAALLALQRPWRGPLLRYSRQQDERGQGAGAIGALSSYFIGSHVKVLERRHIIRTYVATVVLILLSAAALLDLCYYNELLLGAADALKQFESGIPAKDVVCNQSLELIFKAEDGSPACVKPDTATKLVEQGWAKPEEVDKAIEYGHGRRLPVTGPICSADLGGLDIFHSISSYLFKDLCNYSEPFKLMQDKVEAGNLGSKSGQGFYNWSPKELEIKQKERVEVLSYFLQRDQAKK